MSEFRDLLANDGFAATFQTMGQYRTELLRAIDKLRAQADARPFGWWYSDKTGEHFSKRGPDSYAPGDLSEYEVKVTPLYTHPKASAPGLSEAVRAAVRDAVAQALGDAYDCTRVWGAWNVGTMSQDDFVMVAEDENRVAEIADAAIDALTRASAATVAEPSDGDEIACSSCGLTMAQSRRLSAQQQAEPSAAFEYANKLVAKKLQRKQAEPLRDETDAFEAWARGECYDMARHPLHYLFLNERTYAARQGWKAALQFAGQRAEHVGIAREHVGIQKPEPSKPVYDCSTQNCQCDACCIERGTMVPINDVQQAEPVGDLAKLLWDAAKAIQWHLEPKSPDEHEVLMKRLYAESAAQSGQRRGTSDQILTERRLTCEAIEGAISFGHQNTNPPPSDDHWLASFWKIGRKQAELEQSGQRAGVAEDEDTPAEILCSRLIDAWCDTHGGQIPWDKAIEITAITTKLPDAERLRLLFLDDEESNVPADRQVADLAALVKHLAHQLRKAAPDNDLAIRAADYLKRAGLQGSPMRIAAAPESNK